MCWGWPPACSARATSARVRPATTSSPSDARCLLSAWLAAVGLEDLDGGELIAYMQDDGFSHSDLYRRACRAHERRLREAVDLALGAAHGETRRRRPPRAACSTPASPRCPTRPLRPSWPTSRPSCGRSRRARSSFCGAGAREDDGTPRVAILADGIGSTHGVSRTIQEIRQRGVPGFEIEVLGTDAEVDRRLAAVAEFEVPFYPGLRIGVPSLPGAVQALTDGCFDAVHVCSPGPTGIAGALVARALGLPLLGSYHTELAAYAGMRSGERLVAEAMAGAVALFYNACDLVLSPSGASDRALAAIGTPLERVLRWDRGVDTARFDPALRDAPSRARAASTSCTRDGSPARRASSCSPTCFCAPAAATSGCIS